VITTNQKNLEEIRTEANVILKVVDQFVKAGLLEQAKDHLEKARLIDQPMRISTLFRNGSLF